MSIKGWILGWLLLLAVVGWGCGPRSGGEDNTLSSEEARQPNVVERVVQQSDTGLYQHPTPVPRLAPITQDEIAQARAFLIRWYGYDSIQVDSSRMYELTQNRIYSLWNGNTRKPGVLLCPINLDSLEAYKMRYLQLYGQRIGIIPSALVRHPDNQPVPGITPVTETYRGLEANDTLLVRFEEFGTSVLDGRTNIFIGNRLIYTTVCWLRIHYAYTIKVETATMLIINYTYACCNGSGCDNYSSMVLNLETGKVFDIDWGYGDHNVFILHTNDINFPNTNFWVFNDGKWLDIDNDGIPELIKLTESMSLRQWGWVGPFQINGIPFRITAFRITPQGLRPATDADGRAYSLRLMPRITFSPTRAVWHRDTLVVLGGHWPGLVRRGR